MYYLRRTLEESNRAVSRRSLVRLALFFFCFRTQRHQDGEALSSDSDGRGRVDRKQALTERGSFRGTLPFVPDTGRRVR